MFLGDDLLAWLALALGAALAAGNALALLRPPREPRAEGELDRPPLLRTLAMITVGLVAAVWAIASLAS